MRTRMKKMMNRIKTSQDHPMMMERKMMMTTMRRSMTRRTRS